MKYYMVNVLTLVVIGWVARIVPTLFVIGTSR